MLLPGVFGWNFLSIGDWGVQTKMQSRVASSMGELASQLSPRFVLSLGDNFYKEGVDSIHDDLWQSTFHDVFNHPSLQVPWYSMLGNHDYRKNESAQIAYSELENIWNLPNHYYSKVFSNEGVTVLLVVLDTVILAPHEDASDVPLSMSRSVAQMEWLEETLSKSTADWLLVAGHYPPFSIADHGDQAAVRDMLTPLFEQYGVHAYYCGHDHAMQHFSNRGVEYFVNGNGAYKGVLGDISRTQADITHFAIVSEGVMVHDVSESKLVHTFIDSSGHVLYTYSIVKVGESEQDFAPWLNPGINYPSRRFHILSGWLLVPTAVVLLYVYYRKKTKKTNHPKKDMYWP